MASSCLQFSSVAQSCLTLCDPMNPSTLGLPVHHQLPEFTETHVHRVSDAIQPSHPLLSPSPPAPIPPSIRVFSNLKYIHGEGNGSPLQCSCLENPRDRGAWGAAVYGVAQCRTQLKQLSSSRIFLNLKASKCLNCYG